MTSDSELVTLALAPSPGFCVKTSALRSGSYILEQESALLEPSGVIGKSAGTSADGRKTMDIREGLKVFVNVAWDKGVPAPRDGSGEEAAVPVLVSHGREVFDKAGAASLVFDAVFSSTLKSRAAKDDEFKLFLVETALQQIEAASGIPLSRDIRTPNIPSKGKLEKRTVKLPKTIFGAAAGITTGNTWRGKKLIEEVSASTTSELGDGVQPEWSWKTEEGRIRVDVRVPAMTREMVTQAALDLEPGRIVLEVPGVYSLDVATETEMKGARSLDVTGARAEWRVGEGMLVIFA